MTTAAGRNVRRRQVLGFPAWIALCFLAPAAGSPFQPGAWYAALDKPSWTPPGYLFGPVWTVLYVMMATAAWMVWNDSDPKVVRWPLILFAVQLGLNAAWTPLFFGLRRPDLAFVVLLALLVALTVTIALFRRVRVAAALLLMPYLAWCAFAAALNYRIWMMNQMS